MRFGLQLRADEPAGAVAEARRAEELGFDVVLVADHIGSDWGPLALLTAIAGATARIRIGTYVLNAGLHHPLMLAREIATLDHLSGGRVELGLGAGHTPAEFAAAGVPFESARRRKARLVEVVDVMGPLLAGETVDHDGEHVTLHGASIRPARQSPVPILIGGRGPGLLTHAGRRAQIVGLTGMGRTLPDGHRHAVRWQPDVLAADLALVRAGAAGRPVELSALVQVVDVTDDRTAAAEALAGGVDGLSVQDALTTPFLALGTVAEIAEHLRDVERRWGIGYVVVREAEAFAPVLARLRTRIPGAGGLAR